MNRAPTISTLAAVILAGAVHAQEFPQRPIRFIVPQATGGSNDTLGRLMGHHLSERLGKQVVIDNRPGATGAIAGEMIAKAQPDGYTVMMLAVAQLVANAIEEKLVYDVERDFAGVSYVARNPYLVAVQLGLPARSVRIQRL